MIYTIFFSSWVLIYQLCTLHLKQCDLELSFINKVIKLIFCCWGILFSIIYQVKVQTVKTPLIYKGYTNIQRKAQWQRQNLDSSYFWFLILVSANLSLLSIYSLTPCQKKKTNKTLK